MLPNRLAALLFLPMLVFADDTWKNKRAAEWTEAETKRVLTDSPWCAMVTPTVKKEAPKQPGYRGPVIGGVPGMNRRRTDTQQQESQSGGSEEARPFNIRWESALPVREAELKAREATAPDVDETHYAIAIYGIPGRFAKPDARSLGEHLKGQASIKRENQKDLKPSGVDVVEHDDGLVIVFLFPKTKEISSQDSRAEFNAQIGPYQFTQSFHLDEMIYQGKPEL
jgi:hypothetical protein